MIVVWSRMKEIMCFLNVSSVGIDKIKIGIYCSLIIQFRINDTIFEYLIEYAENLV